MKEDKIILEGIVKEILGGGEYKVEISEGVYVRARIAGKLSKNNIKIIVGDKVKVELSEYDPTKGRIIQRMNFKFNNQ